MPRLSLVNEAAANWTGTECHHPGASIMIDDPDNRIGCARCGQIADQGEELEPFFTQR